MSSGTLADLFFHLQVRLTSDYAWIIATEENVYGMTIFKNQTAEECCQSCCTFYQSKLPDISALSSETLLNEHLASDNIHNAVLIDCRTAPERNVSMIEGAISLQEFEKAYRHQHSNNTVHVITYCTIGYRSGMEARRS